MSSYDDKARMMRQVARLEGGSSKAETEQQALSNFQNMVSGVVSEEALATVVGDRVHKHMENYARSRRMLDLPGVTELLYVMWAEGFLVGQGYAKEKITGQQD